MTILTKTLARRIEGADFREALGHYPTGVCVVTAIEEGEDPVGMVVGSFTSVSLDSALVGFFPGRESTSWPRIQRAGRFRINELGTHQREMCRRFSVSSEDRFSGLDYRISANGTPVLDDVVAWIDRALDAVHVAGDHYIAIGNVLDLEVAGGNEPLLFCRGDYGGFSPLAMIETA